MYTDQPPGMQRVLRQSHPLIQYMYGNSTPQQNRPHVLNTVGVSPPYQTAGAAEESPDLDASVQQHTHFMFLAQVLVGHFTTGKSFMTQPPDMDPSNPFSQKYDSCSDTLFGPRIFSVFETAQCYPEYVIEYTYKKAHR